jgi:hypothetical protein
MADRTGEVPPKEKIMTIHNPASDLINLTGNHLKVLRPSPVINYGLTHDYE